MTETREPTTEEVEFIVHTLRVVADDAEAHSGEAPEWFRIECLREVADVITALAASRRSATHD